LGDSIDFCPIVRSAAASVGGSVSSCDEKDSAFKLFAGYRVNPNFALEASYIDYGEASARGIVPLGNRFSLFGKAGVLMSDIEGSSVGAFGPASASESETGLHIGVGAMFDISPTFAIRAEWERNDELETDMMSIGLQVRF
jgi:OOP family OmpA-OmpF porin